MMILVNNVAVLLTVEDGTNSLSQNIRSQLADCVMSCRPRRAKAPVSAIFKSSIHWRSHCLEFLWKDRKNQFYSTKACKKGSTIFGRNTLTSPYISFFGLSLLMPSVQDAVSWTQSHCTASWCHLYRMLSAGHSHIVLLPDAICTGCCQLHTVTLYCFLMPSVQDAVSWTQSHCTASFISSYAYLRWQCTCMWSEYMVSKWGKAQLKGYH